MGFQITSHHVDRAKNPGNKSTYQSTAQQVLRLPRNLQTSHMSKSQDSLPHVQKSGFTAPVTKSGLLDDHHHVQSAVYLPRKLHFEAKQLRSLAPVTKSRLWSTKTRGFPCACHEKSPPCAKMHTAPQRERSRWKHPLPPPRFCEPAQSKCTWTMSRGMNVL